MRKIFVVLACIWLIPTKGISYDFDESIEPNDVNYLWMDQQIEKEFEPFSLGIYEEQLDQTATYYRCLRYKIINNQVYGEDGKIKNLLTEVCYRYPVPDADIVYLNEDGVIYVNGFHPDLSPGPCLVSTKHEACKSVICFSDWNFDPYRTDIANHSSVYDWCVALQFVNYYSNKKPWRLKKSCLVWRGFLQGMHDYSPNGFVHTPRGKACCLSIQYPDLIDAGTNFGVDHPVIKTLIKNGINPHKSFMNYDQQLDYKYLLCVDGHTCCYPGIQWRMLSNSTVLLQITPNKMWFHGALKPWDHYVPLREGLEDLLEKVTWCIEHDNEARRIAENGRKAALENLMPKHCFLYCYKVLKKYAELQKFTPHL